MTNVSSFPDVYVGTRTGVLFVDANTLINFDKAGALDLLLAANRAVIITSLACSHQRV
jgi:hypothetical protein